MRASTRFLAILLILLASASALEAQWFMPQRVAIDSSLRMEFLFGSQLLRSVDGDLGPVDVFKVEYNPRLPVLAGTVEISPFRLISGRLAGALSILETDMTSSRGVVFLQPPSTYVAVTPISRWVTQPDYQSWEAALLYHLHKGGGYRFSLVAGYRQTVWHYHGELEQGGDSRLRDSFSSRIPFIGMQTGMFFPWWKARFEIIGSPFMRKSSVVSIQTQSTAQAGLGNVFSEQNVETDQGGLIEFRIEGTVNLTTNLWLGVMACYHYQELYGQSTGRSSVPPVNPANLNNYYTRESFASLGLNFNVIY